MRKLSHLNFAMIAVGIGLMGISIFACPTVSAEKVLTTGGVTTVLLIVLGAIWNRTLFPHRTADKGMAGNSSGAPRGSSG